MTFAFSFGRYGGFYLADGRLCLGWVALTYFARDSDDVLEAGLAALTAHKGDAA